MKTAAWAGLALSAALLAAPAWSQGDPSIDQIYQAASSGQMQEADRMIDQVLQHHPNSAKAHYVKAELAAREANAGVARRELAEAERLAPGLPFAKADAVAALRREVQGGSRAATPAARGMGAAPAEAPVRAPASSHFPWGLIALAVLVIVAASAFMRRRTAGPDAMPYGGVQPGGPMGPVGPGGGYGGAPYGGYPGQGGYAPGAGYPPPQGGLGSTLGRGLATGLAVGAGAVAAEEIGRRIFDHRGNPVAGDAAAPYVGGAEGNGMLDPSINSDMGGNDFGIGDAGSWDDGGGAGGGSDWDN